MELGESLKYFLSKAKIVISYENHNINLLSYFPLLKNGYGSSDTIKNIFNLYIKINKLNKENKIVPDKLFLESFNSSIPISNYKLVGNKYCYSLHLYEYIVKYKKFEYVNLLISHHYLDPINCPESLKLQYNNLINAITELNLLKTKDFLSVKEIFVRNYIKCNVNINTFDFLKSCYEKFNYDVLHLSDIKDIIDININVKDIETSEISKDLEKEQCLSYELLKIFKLMEQDNVFEAAVIRNNNTYVKIIEPNFNNLVMILNHANYSNCDYVLRTIFNNNYYKLLHAVTSNHLQGVYICLHELNVDPRDSQNSLYCLAKNDIIKEMILNVSIKKNFLQQIVISDRINEIVGFGYGDLSNSINDYINKNII